MKQNISSDYSKYDKHETSLIEDSISKQMTNKNQDIHAVIEKFPDILVFLNQDGIIIDIQGTYQKNINISQRDTGKSITGIIPQNMTNSIMNIVRDVQQNKNTSINNSYTISTTNNSVNARLLALNKEQYLLIIRSHNPFYQNNSHQSEKERLEKEIRERKRAEELHSVLFNISESTNLSDNLYELLNVIHIELSRLVDTTNFFVALYDENKEAYTFPYFVDAYDDIDQFTTIQLKKSLTDYVRRSGKAILIDEKTHKHLANKGEVDLIGTPSPSWMGAPLKTNQSIIGVVVVQSYIKNALYSRKDLDLLSFVSEHIAFAIERKKIETEKKKAEKAKENSERLYRSAIEATGAVPYYKIFRNEFYEFIGDGIIRLTGYASNEFSPQLFKKISQDVVPLKNMQNTPLLKASKKIELEKGLSWKADVKILTKSGQEKWLTDSSVQVKNDNGDIVGTLGLLQDITDRKQVEVKQHESELKYRSLFEETKLAEQQITNSLKEKEVLLKEIHHRVKNNMQVISSLLSLQSQFIQDDEALSLFKESQTRVKTMALIHEKLYQSNDLAKIKFDEYIHHLTHHLFDAYTEKQKFIKFIIKAQDISLAIDSAIPCGLVINELISNSLKYAFPDDKEGEICIAMESIENGMLKLVIQDNGIGLSPDIDFRNTDSLGLQLICTLTEQLDGHIELCRDNGTKFTISFPSH